MKKRLISLFLALVMVLSLFPMAAFAADGGDSSVNPATGREAGPAGNRKVAMMLYGKTISDAVMKSNYDIDDFWAALKAEAQGVLGSEKIPEVEVYLVNDQNQEYKLEPSTGTATPSCATTPPLPRWTACSTSSPTAKPAPSCRIRSPALPM